VPVKGRRKTIPIGSMPASLLPKSMQSLRILLYYQTGNYWLNQHCHLFVILGIYDARVEHDFWIAAHEREKNSQILI